MLTLNYDEKTATCTLIVNDGDFERVELFTPSQEFIESLAVDNLAALLDAA